MSAPRVEFIVLDGERWVEVHGESFEPVLVYDLDEWRAFVAGVKAGEFDVPD